MHLRYYSVCCRAEENCFPEVVWSQTVIQNSKVFKFWKAFTFFLVKVFLLII